MNNTVKHLINVSSDQYVFEENVKHKRNVEFVFPLLEIGGVFMTLHQLQHDLQLAADEKIPEEQARICRELLASAIDYIFEKAGEEKPSQGTMLELLDS